MSNIPSSAILAAFVPVQRATNEQLRARTVQSRKNEHHTEEVEELDDTAVNSVRDQQDHEGGADFGREKKKKEKEKVEIESLKTVPLYPGKEQEGEKGLDISA